MFLAKTLIIKFMKQLKLHFLNLNYKKLIYVKLENSEYQNLYGKLL
ncbi:hypothetical protein CTK_C26640 [Clostridium tyrobutyricum]|nr:hypothetical protein CTK_C26640 [Clostridium tyrobutyricum]